MTITLRIFTTFREIIGAKEISLTLPPGDTVGALLETLCKTYPGLRQHLFDAAGQIKPYLVILKNGRNVASLHQLDTALDADDVIALFPPIAGG